MAVRIRLMRMGKIRNPQYRIVVADSRTKRDGKAIEFVGIYHPKDDPSRIEVKSDRVQYWLSVGAQPSDPVIAILSKTGDWQKFKGLPPPTEPLKVAPAKVDRKAVYEAEAKAAAGVSPKAEPAAKPAKKATGASRSTSRDQAEGKEVQQAPKADKRAEAKPEAKTEDTTEAKTEAQAEETAVAAGDEQQG